jgi:hypothetical protein
LIILFRGAKVTLSGFSTCEKKNDLGLWANNLILLQSGARRLRYFLYPPLPPEAEGAYKKHFPLVSRSPSAEELLFGFYYSEVVFL